MNDKYKHLEGSVGAPPPYDSFHQAENLANATIEYNGYTLTTMSAERPLKSWRTMRYLALIELMLAVVCIVLGSACVGTSVSLLSKPTYHVSVGYCLDASGIWVGIVCVVTGSLGLAALGVPTGRRCLLTSYFVLSILCTIGCGILLIFSSMWAALSRNYIYNGSDSGYYLAIFIFNIILIAASLTHFIMSIVSTGLVCYNWSCCGSKPNVTIIQSNAPRQEVVNHASSTHNV